MITAYLHQMAEFQANIRPKEGWDYQSYEELVLDHGTLYTEARLEVSGEIKECFTNAYYAATESGWTYVEGYASSIIPVAHAWCLDDEGVVVETTWPEVGTEYYGIPMSTDWVARVSVETGYWGVFANDWMRDFALLREGLPVMSSA